MAAHDINEKRAHEGEIEQRDVDSSPDRNEKYRRDIEAATQGDPVVTYKTWMVVMVGCPHKPAVKSGADMSTRSSQLLTAYHSSRSHSSAKSRDSWSLNLVEMPQKEHGEAGNKRLQEYP